MSPARRAPMDPLPPDWNRDPLRPIETDDELAPRPRPDGAPGPVLVLAIVGIPLLICAGLALWWMAQ